MSVGNFGALLKSRREATLDETTGKPYTQARIAELLADRVGEPISRTAIAEWETGATKKLRPQFVNALSTILPMTVSEAVQAMGYETTEGPRLTDEERQLLAMYRRLKPDLRRAVRRVAQELHEPLEDSAL